MSDASPLRVGRAPRAVGFLVSLCALSCLVASVVPAQRPSRGSRFSCDGLVVSEIVVDARKPTVGGIYDRLHALGRKRQDIHITTREPIIRRFLALKEGDVCTDLRRSESARILRAQPFIADAQVEAAPDGQGGVRLTVITEDELSIIVGASVAGGSHKGLQGAKLGTLNLRGTAVSVLGQWGQGFAYRDLWAMRITDYQAMGRPYQLWLSGERRPLGGAWEAGIAHPFFTDLQRLAWRITGGDDNAYVRFLRADSASASLAALRRYVDIGGVVRVGAPGLLSLFGASITKESESVAEQGVIVTDTGLVPDTSAVLVRRYPRHRTGRVNALWGVRNIDFVRVFGFDALAATQDMRTGFQLGTLFGRSLTAIGSGDDDIFVSTDLYTGFGSARAFTAFQLQGEGRQDYDRNRWDGVVGSGRGALYLKPARAQTTTLDLEYGAGWRQRTPFQLALGDAVGGVRGYHGSRAAGGQRLVARLEHHWLLSEDIRRAAVGLAFFSDAGRMWAGDVPFGRATAWNSSAGLGLLVALPSNSRRSWRLDAVMPFGPDRKGRYELRLTSTDRTRKFWEEPADVRRGRERGTPSSVFNWP